MVRRRRAGVVGAVVLASSFLLAGFTGYAELSGSGRHKSVASRTAAVTIAGWDDQYASHSICVYQQTRDANYMATLGCAWPSLATAYTDSCGRTFYYYYLNLTLLGNDKYWSKDGGTAEMTRLYAARSGSGGGILTRTADLSLGPADSSSCLRSYYATNGSVTPITVYNGAVPADLACSGSGDRSFAGCPFSCTMNEGCDALYGMRQNEYYDAAYRVNLDSQSTATTLYDHYGFNGAAGTPPTSWTYQLEHGICPGGSNAGAVCEIDGNCPGSYCNNGWTVLRRNAVTGDSLNIRRGERRRDSFVEAWVKQKYVDADHLEIGLVSRFYSNNNYFVFVAQEYGGDQARIHKVDNAVYYVVGSATPALNLLSWTRLGFKVRDIGSYQLDNFVPSGNCEAVGYVSGAAAVNVASTPCAFAPYGLYGVQSYYNGNAEFWDLDAYVCNGSGTCFK